MSNFNEEQLCVELENMMRLGRSADGVYSLQDLDPDTVIDEHGTSLLHLSVKYGKLSMTKYLLQLKCNVDVQNEQGDTPLILSLYNYQIAQALILLKANANIHIANNAGESALQIVFGKKCIDFTRPIDAIVERIHEAGMSNEELAELLLSCDCPIYHALKFRKPCVIRMMLEEGCEINAVDFIRGETALHKAAQLGLAKLVKVLLQHGADVNTLDRNGVTPYEMYIVQRNSINLEVVKLLTPDKMNWTDPNPLNENYLKLHGIFRMSDKIGLQLFLQENSVNLNVKDAHGNTPFHYLMDNCNTGVIELFRNKKFDINAVNNSKQTALHVALECKAPIRILQFLLENGADVNMIDKMAYTPLYLACSELSEEERREIIPLLLKYGADVNATCRRSGGLMHCLAEKGKTENLDFFQNSKLDINALGSKGQTPLFVAAKGGFFDFVKWLLWKGADVNIPCNFGSTPIFAVLSSGTNESERLKCIAILLIYGAQLICRSKGIFQTYIIDEELNIIDAARSDNVLSLLSPILAHLATCAELGQPINEGILGKINEIPQLKNQFAKYQSWLQNAKTEMIHKNISLFRILTVSTKNVTDYAKPDMVFKKALDRHGASMDVYFKLTLEHRYCLAQKVEELRNEASHIISESIGFFDSTHIAIDKIVSFLKFADLEILA